MFIKLVLVHPQESLRLPVTIKIYVKSIICHAAGTGINTGTAQVYYCPSGITSGPTNKIFDVDVNAGETDITQNQHIQLCQNQLVISQLQEQEIILESQQHISTLW